MIYIYDILLNWTDTDKIYEFFEWLPNDSIEHIKKMPLLKVDSALIQSLLEGVVQIDASFLSEIDDKSEIFCEKSTETIAYACLFTDAKRVIAVEFDPDGRSIYRSHLLLDEEVEILEIAERLSLQELSYQVLSKNASSTFFTREEQMRKRYLLREFKNTYQSKNLQKMGYLYSEYFTDCKVDLKEMYQNLIDSLNEEFNEKHQRLYQLLKLSHTKKQV